MNKKISTYALVEGWNRFLNEAPPDEETDDTDDDTSDDTGDDEEEPTGDEDDGDDDAGDEEQPEEEPIEQPPAVPKVEPGHEDKPEDSLDNQIDSLLIDFEKESMKQESLWRRSRLGRALLAELADDEDEDSDVHVDDGEESTFNIDVFTQRTARLINNYDKMLDVKGAIMDRAMNYLKQNYDDAAMEEFEEIMSVQHGIEHAHGEKYPTYGPPAVGAEGTPSDGGIGVSGGGSLGGGDVGGGLE